MWSAPSAGMGCQRTRTQGGRCALTRVGAEVWVWGGRKGPPRFCPGCCFGAQHLAGSPCRLEMACRTFCCRQCTFCTRPTPQRHHLAREVFLLSGRDVASVESILRRAVRLQAVGSWKAHCLGHLPAVHWTLPIQPEGLRHKVDCPLKAPQWRHSGLRLPVQHVRVLCPHAAQPASHPPTNRPTLHPTPPPRSTCCRRASLAPAPRQSWGRTYLCASTSTMRRGRQAAAGSSATWAAHLRVWVHLISHLGSSHPHCVREGGGRVCCCC